MDRDCRDQGPGRAGDEQPALQQREAGALVTESAKLQVYSS
jgi:hypothetical protein